MDACDSDWISAPEGRWNSAQILEHLGRSYGTTAKMLELNLGSGRPPELRDATIGEFLATLLIVKLGVFPTGAKAPAIVTPHGEAGPVALNRALTDLVRMDAAIAATAERWGKDKAIALHPRLGPLNASQWRKFHYVHGHHHVLQIRKRLGVQ